MTIRFGFGTSRLPNLLCQISLLSSARDQSVLRPPKQTQIQAEIYTRLAAEAETNHLVGAQWLKDRIQDHQHLFDTHANAGFRTETNLELLARLEWEWKRMPILHNPAVSATQNELLIPDDDFVGLNFENGYVQNPCHLSVLGENQLKVESQGIEWIFEKWGLPKLSYQGNWTWPWLGLADFDGLTARQANECMTFSTNNWRKSPVGNFNYGGLTYVLNPVTMSGRNFWSPWSDLSRSLSVRITKGLDLLNPPESARNYSSVLFNDTPGVGHARSKLDSPQAWTARNNTAGQWMQIDLGQANAVRGVTVQCRTNSTECVHEFSIKYSLDGSSWHMIRSPNSTFYSPPDGYTPRAIIFPVVRARYVRFMPVKWKNRISMRAGVWVNASEAPCSRNDGTVTSSRYPCRCGNATCQKNTLCRAIESKCLGDDIDAAARFQVKYDGSSPGSWATAVWIKVNGKTFGFRVHPGQVGSSAGISGDYALGSQNIGWTLAANVFHTFLLIFRKSGNHSFEIHDGNTLSNVWSTFFQVAGTTGGAFLPFRDTNGDANPDEVMMLNTQYTLNKNGVHTLKYFGNELECDDFSSINTCPSTCVWTGLACAVKWKLGQAEASSCPYGSARIDDASTCSLASAELGFSYQGQIANAAASKGCYKIAGNSQLNIHAAGGTALQIAGTLQSLICKTLLLSFGTYKHWYHLIEQHLSYHDHSECCNYNLATVFNRWWVQQDPDASVAPNRKKVDVNAVPIDGTTTTSGILKGNPFFEVFTLGTIWLPEDLLYCVAKYSDENDLDPNIAFRQDSMGLFGLWGRPEALQMQAYLKKHGRPLVWADGFNSYMLLDPTVDVLTPVGGIPRVAASDLEFWRSRWGDADIVGPFASLVRDAPKNLQFHFPIFELKIFCQVEEQEPRNMVMGFDGNEKCVYWTMGLLEFDVNGLAATPAPTPAKWECLNDGTCAKSNSGLAKYTTNASCTASCSQETWACVQAGSRHRAKYCRPLGIPLGLPAFTSR